MDKIQTIKGLSIALTRMAYAIEGVTPEYKDEYQAVLTLADIIEAKISQIVHEINEVL